MLIPLIIISTLFVASQFPLPIAVAISIVQVTVFWVALFRFVLLTFAAVMMLPEVLELPLLALAAWSFRNALAGQPVFRDNVLK